MKADEFAKPRAVEEEIAYVECERVNMTGDQGGRGRVMGDEAGRVG